MNAAGNTNVVLAAAVNYAKLGLSPIPVFSAQHSDEAKRKRSTIKWKPFQERIASEKEIRSFFNNGADIALICGKVSGGMEIIDFDAPEDFPRFMDTLKGHDAQLADKLITQTTPSGGYHLLYRCEGSVPGNQKLAMAADGKTVKIETRGTAGYALIHPSAGYKLQSDLAQLQVISRAERNLLIWLAQSFDESVKPSAVTTIGTPAINNRPGDIFNRTADWHELLTSDGWSFIKTVGDHQHWCRPGKKSGATSATLNDQGLFVFSSSTPLPTEIPLDQFAYVAHMKFSGDFSATARYIMDNYPQYFQNNTPDNSGRSGQLRKFRTDADALRTGFGQQPDNSRTLAEEVLAFIEMEPEPFTNNDVYSDLCVRYRRDKKTICDALYYYQKQGKIKKIEGKRGHWEIAEEAPQAMDLLSADEDPFNILLPLGLSDHVVIRPGGIILVAGASNAAKSLFLMTVVRNFLPHTHKHTNVNPSFINKREEGLKITYLNSEMSSQELVARIKSFGDDPKLWIPHIKFIERTHSFDRVIDPDGLNFVDFLEVNEDFFMAGKYIATIHKKLSTGIAIIAMQKKQGHQFAKGGEMTLEKPRLVINLDRNDPHGFLAKITKAKELVDYKKPIQGMECDFRVTAKSEIIPISKWRFVNERQRRAINIGYDRELSR